MNKFSDWTESEMSRLYAGKRRKEAKTDKYRPKYQGTFPIVNWTSYMNPVRDQRYCGASYAFASVAAVEGSFNIKYNQTVELSEQQEIDCNYLTYGCDGGAPVDALNYLKTYGAYT